MDFHGCQPLFAVSMTVGARLRENTLRFGLFQRVADIRVSFNDRSHAGGFNHDEVSEKCPWKVIPQYIHENRVLPRQLPLPCPQIAHPRILTACNVAWSYGTLWP